MSDALRIAHGQFGRVALLDMDAPLVRHAHPHCHVLIKAEGADTQFMVRSWFAPLTGENAVLINARLFASAMMRSRCAGERRRGANIAPWLMPIT